MATADLGADRSAVEQGADAISTGPGCSHLGACTSSRWPHAMENGQPADGLRCGWVTRAADKWQAPPNYEVFQTDGRPASRSCQLPCRWSPAGHLAMTL